MFNAMEVSFHRKTLCDRALLGSDWLDIISMTIRLTDRVPRKDTGSSSSAAKPTCSFGD